MLRDNDPEFSFDISLMTEEHPEEDEHAMVYCYDGQDYAVYTEDEIHETYYDRQVEWIRDDPHEYASNYCDGICVDDALSSIESYDCEHFEGIDDLHVVKR